LAAVVRLAVAAGVRVAVVFAVLFAAGVLLAGVLAAAVRVAVLLAAGLAATVARVVDAVRLAAATAGLAVVDRLAAVDRVAAGRAVVDRDVVAGFAALAALPAAGFAAEVRVVAGLAAAARVVGLAAAVRVVGAFAVAVRVVGAFAATVRVAAGFAVVVLTVAAFVVDFGVVADVLAPAGRAAAVRLVPVAFAVLATGRDAVADFAATARFAADLVVACFAAAIVVLLLPLLAGVRGLGVAVLDPDLLRCRRVQRPSRWPCHRRGANSHPPNVHPPHPTPRCAPGHGRVLALPPRPRRRARVALSTRTCWPQSRPVGGKGTSSTDQHRCCS
jgi:hypothetical protein